MITANLTMATTLVLVYSLSAIAQDPASKALATESTQFRSLMRGSPRLPLKLSEFSISSPATGLKIEMASSVSVDRKGLIYVLQRGADAEPVIVVTRQGQVLRSWGMGLYNIPHNVRTYSSGNIWTGDEGSAMDYKL